MNRSISVSAVQFTPGSLSQKESMERLAPLIRGASELCELIVLPELTLTKYLYSSAKEILPFAEEAGGRFLEYLKKMNTGKAHIIAGFIEKTPEDKLYNSAYILFPDNTYKLYRKTLLFEADETWAEPGNIPYPLFFINGFSVTVGICMDLNDHRFNNYCKKNQINIIALPVNWLDQDEDVRPYWKYRLGYECMLVAANKYGSEKNIQFRGYSTIMYSDYILAEMGSIGDGMIYYKYEE